MAPAALLTLLLDDLVRSRAVSLRKGGAGGTSSAVAVGRRLARALARERLVRRRPAAAAFAFFLVEEEEELAAFLRPMVVRILSMESKGTKQGDNKFDFPSFCVIVTRKAYE